MVPRTPLIKALSIKRWRAPIKRPDWTALEWLCLGGRKGAVTLPGAYERTLIKRLISANLKGCVMLQRATRDGSNAISCELYDDTFL